MSDSIVPLSDEQVCWIMSRFGDDICNLLERMIYKRHEKYELYEMNHLKDVWTLLKQLEPHCSAGLQWLEVQPANHFCEVPHDPITKIGKW